MDSPPPQRQAAGYAPPPGLAQPAMDPKDVETLQRRAAEELARAPARGLNQNQNQAIADYAFQSSWMPPQNMGKGAGAYYGHRQMPVGPSRAPGAHLAPAPNMMPAPGQRASAAAYQSLQMFQAQDVSSAAEMEESSARQRAAQAELAKENARRLENNVNARNATDAADTRTAAENAAKENARRLKNSPLIRDMAAKDSTKGPRYTGILKVFRPEHGWGFIENAELKTKYGYDVFLNQTVEGGIRIGSLVSFTVEISKEGKPQARNARMEAETVDKPKNSNTGPNVEELVGQVFKGRVKSFNVTNGFGFLTCDELKAKFGGRDVYVNHTQVPGNKPMATGHEYEFKLFLNNQQQPQARELKSLQKLEDYSNLGELPTAQSVGEKLFGR